jgi:small conductance mechanosensitive channel
LIEILGITISSKIVYAILTLAIGYLIYRVLLYIINKSFAIRMKRFKLDSRRQKTINAIINNILKYTFGVILVITLLGIIGVNASALVASIGVVGLAIGLAIQDILKDVLAGIFILVENQFAIGDTVMIGTFKGEVIFLGLRSTKIRSETGEIKILSNRNIVEITNYSLDSSLNYIDVDLAYDNDESTVDNMFNVVISKMTKELETKVEYLGVQSIGDKNTYRISFGADSKHQNEYKSKILAELKKAIDTHEVRR